MIGGLAAKIARRGDRYDNPKLSVIVIAYRMAEQARRTLFTLSAGYQIGVRPEDYEVIVVENESDDMLTARQVRSNGPNFHYLRRSEAGVSPAPAVNHGLAHARGQYVCLMIDGARMVTPQVLRNAFDAFAVNENAVVAVPGFHLGSSDHQFQHDGMDSIASERALLDSVPWQTDGYRLFDVSVLSGANPYGVLQTMMESNCLFASRAALDEIGVADERFDLPGGGMLNLDIYRQLLDREEAQLFVMPGEGNFHQFHGGVTTKHDAEREALMQAFNQQYRELRGEEKYLAPRREPFLIGEVRDPALPALMYSAHHGRRHYESWSLREQPDLPWVDDATVLAPELVGNPPPRDGSPRPERNQVSIYLPPSVRRFEPKHLAFSTWVDHIQFGYDIVEAVRPKLLVELGTQAGLSYFTFCQSMKENDIEGLCYAVDTWEGEQHTGAYDESVWNRVSDVNRENYTAFSYLLRMYFSEAAKNFDPDTIDLLHIDGLHTYDAVREDFETWYPKVKPGGIILMHDIAARIQDFGVWRYWEEISSQHASFAFTHGFGLGVIRKEGGEPSDSELLKLLFDSTPAEQQQLRRFYEHAAYFHHVKRQAAKAHAAGIV